MTTPTAATSALPQGASDTTPVQPDHTPPNWIVPVAGFALAAVASSACWVIGGPLHGVLFGTIAAAALLTPSLAAANRDSRWTLLLALSLLLGCLVGLTIALFQDQLNSRILVTSIIVSACFILALAGVTALLVLVRVSPSVAATIVTLLALAWLSWPIWLSPVMSGNEALVSILSPAHPLLTVDAAITREGGVPWTEHRLMYAKLTVLGQHVFSRPPTGVQAAAAWHGGVGGGCLLLVMSIQWWARRRAAKAIPSAPAPY